MIQCQFRLPITGTAVGILVLAFFAANYLGADEVLQREQTTSEAVVAPVEEKEVQSEVEELVQLRQRLGSAWRGDTVGLTDGSDAESLPSEDEVIRTALVAQARASQFIPIPPDSQRVPDWRATLRAAAHELDLTAYSLECQELYAQADELRTVAQRFRLQARGEGMPDLPGQEKSWKPAPAKAAD